MADVRACVEYMKATSPMRRDPKDANPANGPLWSKNVKLKDCSWCGLEFNLAGGGFYLCAMCDTPEVKTG